MFKNIKLAFYDFDRTLCVHTYPSDDLGKAHFDYEQECYLQYHMQKQVLQGDMPVEYMRWYEKHLKETGVLTGNGLHLLKVKEGYANAQ